jgi:hypothetical protein
MISFSYLIIILTINSMDMLIMSAYYISGFEKLLREDVISKKE